MKIDKIDLKQTTTNTKRELYMCLYQVFTWTFKKRKQFQTWVSNGTEAADDI